MFQNLQTEFGNLPRNTVTFSSYITVYAQSACNQFADPCASLDLKVQTVDSYYVIDVIFTASIFNSFYPKLSESHLLLDP